MWDWINQLLSNNIIISWIAPIFTGLVVIAVSSLVANRFRSKVLLNRIQAANKKYTDCIRPFIIQRNSVTPQIISSIRESILQESGLKSPMIYTEKEVCDKILLDITETRFLTEQDKSTLIDFTYETFSTVLAPQTAPNESFIEQEQNRIHKISTMLWALILLGTILVLPIVMSVTPQNIKLQDNPAIIICIITSIIAIINLLLAPLQKYDITIDILSMGGISGLAVILAETINSLIFGRKNKSDDS